MAVWSECLWGLCKTVATGNQCQRRRLSNGAGGRQHDKSAGISTTKVSFNTLLDIDDDGVVRIFAGHSEVVKNSLFTWHNFSPRV